MRSSLLCLALLALPLCARADFVSATRSTDPAVTLRFDPAPMLARAGDGSASLYVREGQLLLSFYDADGGARHPFGRLVDARYPATVHAAGGVLSTATHGLRGIASSDDGLLVVWNTSDGIVGRRFDFEGAPLDAEPLSISARPGPLALVFDGEAYRVLHVPDASGGGGDIRQTRVSVAGAVLDHRDVATAERNVYQLAAAPVAGGVLVLHREGRASMPSPSGTRTYAALHLDAGSSSPRVEICEPGARDGAETISVASDGDTRAIALCNRGGDAERVVLEGEDLRRVFESGVDGRELTFDGERFVMAGRGLDFFTTSYGLIEGDSERRWRHVGAAGEGRALLLDDTGQVGVVAAGGVTVPATHAARPNTQWAPVLADGVGGESLLVFLDERAGAADLFGQRLDDRLTPLGPVFPVALRGLGVERHPAIASSGDTYLVVWGDESGDGRVHGARVSAAGAVLDAGGMFLLPGAGRSWARPLVLGVPGGFVVAARGERELAFVPERGPVDPRATHTIDAGGAADLVWVGDEPWLITIDGAAIFRVALSPRAAPGSRAPLHASELTPSGVRAVARGETVALAWIERERTGAVIAQALRFPRTASLPLAGEPTRVSVEGQRVSEQARLALHLDPAGGLHVVFPASDAHGELLAHARLNDTEVTVEAPWSFERAVDHPSLSAAGRFAYQARVDGLFTDRVRFGTFAAGPLPAGAPCDLDAHCASARCVDEACVMPPAGPGVCDAAACDAGCGPDGCGVDASVRDGGCSLGACADAGVEGDAGPPFAAPGGCSAAGGSHPASGGLCLLLLLGLALARSGRRRGSRASAALACALVLGAALVAPSVGDAQALHPSVRTVRAYQRATEARDGQEAVRWVSAGTIAFYERMRRAALTMPAAQLRQRPPLEQLTALSLRVTHDAASLRRMDGRAVLADSIERGHVRGAGRLVVGDVRPTSTEAWVAMRTPSGRQAGELRALREGNEWRLDLLPILRQASAQLERMAHAFAGGDDDAALMMALAMMNPGASDRGDVWVPLANR